MFICLCMCALYYKVCVFFKLTPLERIYAIGRKLCMARRYLEQFNNEAIIRSSSAISCSEKSDDVDGEMTNTNEY